MHALIVSYDFPPSNRVAVQRSLAVVHHLIQLGWKVSVLTVKSECYGQLRSNLTIPQAVANSVYRTSAYNTMKFGFKGKYIDFLTLPDEWITWYPYAVREGKKVLRKEKIDIVFSTCPPFTPHLIAGRLASIAGIPWVADYRDPVVPGRHGVGVIGQQWAIEKTDAYTVRNAASVLFTTDESKRLYASTYGEKAAEKFHVVRNGYYDLPDIDRSSIESAKSGAQGAREILYSGSIYGARDPSTIFAGLKELLEEGKLRSGDITLVFQGESLEAQIAELTAKFGLQEFVRVLPPVDFEGSLKNIYNADALLLIQGERFNLHIPAKAYEYIAAKRRILALCPKAGATAKLLATVPGASVVNSIDEVKTALIEIARSADESVDRDIERFSREAQVKRLSEIMKNAIGTG